MKEIPPGPLMIDISGQALTGLDRERLCHPLVGGIILFARNYRDPQQLAELCGEIHALRHPSLPIAIDHEGGRVQRCREGFTHLPAMRRLGEFWQKDAGRAVGLARAVGVVLATELRARGVDFSFTPVLDLDWGRSGVIGDRSFHSDPEVVVRLARGLIEGLKSVGMIACGKHFPGHGWAEADSHVALPTDERSLEALQKDIEPYRRLKLDAVMPAHVIYSSCDSKCSGFSNYWIDYLRNDIKFDGVIFSDDLSMAGASVAGDIVARADAAWNSGCDMLLVCNAPEAVGELLKRWNVAPDAHWHERVRRLTPKLGAKDDGRAFLESAEYQKCLAMVEGMSF